MNLREQLPILTQELGAALWAKRDPRITDAANAPIIMRDHEEKDALTDLLREIKTKTVQPSLGRKVEPPFWRGLWFWIWNKKIESHVLAAPESLKKEGWVFYSHSALAMVSKALIHPDSLHGDDSAKLRLGEYFVRWPSWFAQFVLLLEERASKPGVPPTHLIFMGWPAIADASEQNNLCDLARKIDPCLRFTSEADHLNDLRSEYRKKMRSIPWLNQ